MSARAPVEKTSAATSPPPAEERKPAPATTIEKVIEATIDRMIESEDRLSRHAEKSLIETLSKLENADALFERRAKLLEGFYMTALKRTRPQDWILFKDKQGNVNAMLAASGAELVAEVYGIRVSNLRPLDARGMFAPDRIDVTADVYELRGACDAYSRVNGREVFGLEMSRRSDEQFTGRAVNDEKKFDFQGKNANPADLRSAVMTGLRTKTVRVLCSMTRVPPSDLEKAWNGTPKKVDECRKGSGFGTGNERRSEAVSDEELKPKKAALRDAILRAVGGDMAAAKSLCKEITANPPKFGGFDSVERLTEGWQVDNAMAKLAAHPTFGNAAKKPAPREPGDDE
ncbi:MAG: hypothetical protein PHS14_17305 [Elusimicrobia bacterium]|nr:hypothetical protein [Elusimicrobiota bacterium]